MTLHLKDKVTKIKYLDCFPVTLCLTHGIITGIRNQELARRANHCPANYLKPKGKEHE